MGLDTCKAPMQSVGNYDLLEKIAEGGMGAIYRGRHRATGQVVAVKVMPAHMVKNSVLVKRFEQEFRTASRLDHPNIVRALDYGESESAPYLVMEFVEGESLGQRLEREGRIPEAEAIRLIAQVAQGLHRAHKQNLVHRDVKPDNILVRSDGVAKLADLGLVKETDTDLNLTRTGRGLGTPHFMAPEQFRNAKGADIRCDIYSLGATLYMMVTGELPFGSTNGPLDAFLKKMRHDIRPPRTLNAALSERVDWAIMRAMSPDPEKRPQTCREFVEDLTGHSTRRASAGKKSSPTVGSLWFLRYRDDEGTTHAIEGTTSVIRQSLKDGLLGDAGNVEAGRSREGPYGPLRSYPEFRDLLGPGSRSLPSAPSSGSWAGSPARARGADSASSAPLPPSSSAAPPMPHIDLDPIPSRSPSGGASPGSGEWLSWVVLFGVIMTITAALAFWFLPHHW